MKENTTKPINLDFIKPELLEYFNVTKEEQKKQLIEISTNEWSSVCPYSQLPDYGTLEISYYPTLGRIIESRSLKMYVLSYRNVGIFQEHAAQKVYDDLHKIVGDSLKVTLTYNIRGGYNETVTIGAHAK